jgi:hypothetical protein
MIRSMEGFTFASALDLNMGYYRIKLDYDAGAQKLLIIVSPLNTGKYNNKHLPMGIKIAWILMFFKISCLSLSKKWNIVKLTYFVDDLLIQRKRSFKDHLINLEMVLARLSIN